MSDYATAAKVKTAMGITVTTDDTYIGDLVSRVSRKIEQYCNRVFFSQSYTEYYDGDGSETIVLEQYPVTALTSVNDDVDRAFGSDTAILTSEIFLDANKGLISCNGFKFQRGKNNVKVVYTAGYSSIPADIEAACIKCACADYLEDKGTVAAFEGDSMIYKPSNLRKEAELLLAPYRKVKV